MCSSPSDYLAPSTTFATNRGANQTLVYSGPVNFAVAAGTTPNSWFINLPLTTPFTYDPSLGQDLMIEIVINSTPGVTPASLSCGFTVASHFCNSVRSVGSTTAATGSLSAFAPVVRLGYTESPGTAKRFVYGTGCNDTTVSLYEQFAPGTFDLGGSVGVTNSIQMVPNGQGGYTVTPGSNQWFTPVAPDLGLGDDAVSTAQAMSFSFPYPGGSTSAVYVGSNGHVYLTSTTSTAATGTGNALCINGAQLSPYWTDLDPSLAAGAGSIHFDDDTINGAVYVTYVGVPMWEATPSTPRFLNTFQVAMFSTGVVEFRYQDCSAPTYAIVTGFSPGAARVPPSTDISASMPFSTAADTFPLQLRASARPVMGNSINLVTSNIPATAPFGALMLNFGGQQGGVSLANMGMPGCDLNISPFFAVSLTFLGGPTSVSTSIAVPANPVFSGISFQFQSVAVVPGANAFGAMTSNGVQLLLGSL